MRDPQHDVAEGIAAAFLAGEWEPEAMARRGQRALGERRRWLRDLALAARHQYPLAPADRPRELARFLAACPPFVRALGREGQLGVAHWYLVSTAMGPTPWPVAVMDSLHDLQDLLGYRFGQLAWLADQRQLEARVGEERLRHYRYTWITKRSGGNRLIEEPKPLLKHVQRVILREVLDAVPSHDAAHGFLRGRSAITYAAGHAGRRMLIHLDLEDFFGTVAAGRVYGIFRACGYPEPVAHLLTALTTNTVPGKVWARRPRRPSATTVDADHRLGQHLRHPHLPQGAPTSPAIANLAAFRLDCRLAGLAGAAGLHYSRYADDLAFSTNDPVSRSRAERLVRTVEEIAAEEGFRVNPFKTFFQRAGQRQVLAGAVINRHLNVARREHDTLKAILHNCARFGPHTQNHAEHPNFAAHLLGRISRVQQLNSSRGARLRAMYDAIDWSAPLP